MILSGAAVLLLLILLYRLFRDNQRTGRLPPGPWQLPILGYLPWIDAEKPHETLTKLARRYGPICALRMGSVYTVLLSDPRTIRQTLASDTFAGRAPLYVTHGIMRGYGLICAEGDLWRDQRKFVAGCLREFGMTKHGPKREKMEKRIVRAADECVSMLNERSVGDPIDPLDTLHHCVGNLMNDIVFGKRYTENDPVWIWLRHLQEEGVKEIGVAAPLNFLPFLRFVPRYNRTLLSLLEGIGKTHQVYRGLLEDHRDRIAKPDNSEATSESFLAAFDREMRKNGEAVGYFVEPQLYHLLADLFGAGTDTTLTTLRWFLLFMAAYPEEQRTIQREMDQRPNGKLAPTLEERSLLPRLDAALAEAQRLRSVTPLGIPHRATSGTRIEGYEVPRDSMIVPLQWAVHTDPAYWKDPLEFRPERFVAEDGTVLKPEAFLPFQAGKRVCVGEELARMTLFLFAGKILDEFEVSVPSGTKVDLEGICGITLVPKPHRLTFTRRR